MSTEAPASTPAATAPAAPAAAPAAEASSTPATVVETAGTKLTKFSAELPTIFVDSEGHKEMWGVELSDESHVPTAVVLQKFLKANNGDVYLAQQQLTKALLWRKRTNPGRLLDEESFDKTKFGDVGYVTSHKATDGKEVIITWNIYGAVKDNKATFGNVEEFIKWRAALMELGVRKLNLASVTTKIPEHGPDPYQMIQVHDYLSVSFFRMDPAVKAASKETIQTFSMAYPELLSHKYFVNVPLIMGWLYGAMKLFVNAATLAKFHPMASGTTLATELTTIKDTLPKEYGGSGMSVKDGETVKLVDPKEPSTAPEVAKEDVAAESTAATAGSDQTEKPVATTAPTEPAMDIVPLVDSSTENKPVATEGSATTADPAAPVPDVSVLTLQDIPEETKKPGAAATTA